MKQLATALQLLMMSAALSGCHENPKDNRALNVVAEDKLYVPEDYKSQLSAMKLSEIAAFPAFHEPFICIAENGSGEQYAVIFHPDRHEVERLPLPYEKILDAFKAEGVDIQSGSDLIGNLHLSEIDDALYWNYDNGRNIVWLDAKGNLTTPSSSGEAPKLPSFSPDLSELKHLKNFTIGRQEDSAKLISLPNHSEAISQEEIDLPAGKATIVKMLRGTSAARENEAGDAAPDYTQYWIYMTRPMADHPDGVDTFYLQADVIDDEAAAKAELIQLAQNWNPLAAKDR